MLLQSLGLSRHQLVRKELNGIWNGNQSGARASRRRGERRKDQFSIEKHVHGTVGRTVTLDFLEAFGVNLL